MAIKRRRATESGRIRRGTGANRTDALADLLSDVSPDPIALFSVEGRLLARNAAAKKAGAPEPGDAPPDAAPPFWSDAAGRRRLLDALAEEDVVENLEVPDPGRSGGRVYWLTARRFEGEGTFVAAARDVTDRLDALPAPRESRDGATGFATREAFRELLEKRLEEADRARESLGLVSFDLDDFKTLNDTHGLAAGDEYLRRLGERLRATFGPDAVLARLGGDEFALLLERATTTSAHEAAERLLSTVRELTPVYDGRPLHVSVSAGVALYPQHASRASDFILVADLALREAKRRGRGRAQLHDPRSGERDRIGVLRLQGDRIRAALAAGSFFPVFQPVQEISSGRVVGVEVLARLREEDGYVAAPDSFLDAAERFGLVTALDRMVLGKAFDALTLARRRVSAELELSLNLSGLDFEDDGLVAEISRLARTKGIRPERVTFEITETAALRDLDRVQNFTRALRAEGFRFALDDFGIGFSSFRYLRDLPMTTLKFDQSYVKTLAETVESRVFVRGIAEICRGFGVKTVAEGVETSEVLGILRELGVDRAQGYFIGHPSAELPAAGPSERTSSGVLPVFVRS